MNSLVRFLPAQLSHSLAPTGLKILHYFHSELNLNWNAFSWRGLTFSNPLGVAGGVDKEAQLIDVWKKWGAGFTEIGTVTPQPQRPNEGSTVMRSWKDQLLWNKLGFPNPGCEAIKKKLSHQNISSNYPLFINIGKNRTTSLERAYEDYSYLAKELAEYGHAFVVNVSSPNTQGLRQLQQGEFLSKIIRQVKSALQEKPCLLKLSPDLSDTELIEVIEIALNEKIDGFIFTNTTLERPSESRFPSDGGLSGRFLAARSRSVLVKALSYIGERKKDLLIVSAGGVLSPEDVFERISLGANLVQVYSALVFNGPQFFSEVATAYQRIGRA